MKKNWLNPAGNKEWKREILDHDKNRTRQIQLGQFYQSGGSHCGSGCPSEPADDNGKYARYNDDRETRGKIGRSGRLMRSVQLADGLVLFRFHGRRRTVPRAVLGGEGRTRTEPLVRNDHVLYASRRNHLLRTCCGLSFGSHAAVHR